MNAPNVRIYSGGAVTDVTPAAPYDNSESLAQAQALSIGGLAWQGSSGLYVCLSGSTANRPTLAQLQANAFNKAIAGTKFFDTTLSLMIVLDGAGAWRNPITGALA
jgi:hypothetical protein